MTQKFHSLNTFLFPVLRKYEVCLPEYLQICTSFSISSSMYIDIPITRALIQTPDANKSPAKSSYSVHTGRYVISVQI